MPRRKLPSEADPGWSEFVRINTQQQVSLEFWFRERLLINLAALVISASVLLKLWYEYAYVASGYRLSSTECSGFAFVVVKIMHVLFQRWYHNIHITYVHTLSGYHIPIKLSWRGWYCDTNRFVLLEWRPKFLQDNKRVFWVVKPPADRVPSVQVYDAPNRDGANCMLYNTDDIVESADIQHLERLSYDQVYRPYVPTQEDDGGETCCICLEKRTSPPGVPTLVEAEAAEKERKRKKKEERRKKKQRKEQQQDRNGRAATDGSDVQQTEQLSPQAAGPSTATTDEGQQQQQPSSEVKMAQRSCSSGCTDFAAPAPAAPSHSSQDSIEDTSASDTAGALAVPPPPPPPSEKQEEKAAQEEVHRCVTLRCGHQFHERCVLRWTKKKTVCPLCQTTVRKFHDVLGDPALNFLKVGDGFVQLVAKKKVVLQRYNDNDLTSTQQAAKSSKKEKEE